MPKTTNNLPQRLRLRHLNLLLAGLIIAINLYIIVAPFWPSLQFWAQDQVTNAAQTPQPTADNSPEYKANTIVIPRLRLKETIFEGPDISTANKGIWRRPSSSTPPKDSNTVLVGHRFLYNKPRGVFYHLDKLKPGDQITVYWSKQAHKYEVISSKVVSPYDKAVEAETSEPRLTLYTCTPLWSAKDRLVVRAKLIEKPET